MKRLAAIVAIVSAVWSCRAAEPTPVLHSVEQVRVLSHEDAARQLPVEFEATVTFSRDYERTLFMQDGTWGIYVLPPSEMKLAPGDRVRVRGRTADSFNPIVISTQIVVEGHASLPPPLPVKWRDLAEATHDCRWVSVRGRVLVAEVGRTSGRAVAHLVLRLDGGLADIIMDNDDPARLKGLLDAEVEITGVAGETFDGKMEQTGVRVHVPSFEFVKVLERSASSPWSLPATPMDRVFRGYNVTDNTPRVRVQGILTYYYQNEMGVLQNGAGAIRVETAQVDGLKVGEEAEAIGIPSVENNLLILKLGSIRSRGAAPPLAPRRIPFSELASGSHPYDLVSVDGEVVTQVQEQTKDVWVISAGGNLFSATLPHPFSLLWPPPARRAAVPVIRPGSRVRVTGVAMLESGNPFAGPSGFNILLRSCDDVAVLAPASWLNVRNLLGLVSLLLVLVLAAMGWAALLRRKVHRQTAELAKRIEAEAILERRRSKILEDINGSRPLDELLMQIAELVTTTLEGLPCWLQVANLPAAGAPPKDERGLRILRQEIRSRSGPLHGTIYVAAAEKPPRDDDALQALSMGAWLATLAIETRSLYSDLVHRSEFDLLTDIYNRFSLERQLSRLVVDGLAHHSAFGLIYIDLDEFKQVNDRYGHRIGDLYLQTIADRMKRQLRPGDMLARMGGDEFAALVPQVRTRADVEEIAARLEQSFDEPFLLEGYTLRGSGSVGLAVFPEDGGTKDALLGAADAAMYDAKRARQQRALEELRFTAGQ